MGELSYQTILFLCQLVLISFLFVLACNIGSFLNVVIYRLPRKMNIATGRSICPTCHTQLKSYDLIPVLSFLLLKGRCRSCQTKISMRYPFVELLTGILGLGIYTIYGFQVVSMFLFLYTTILLCVAFIDIDTMTIPDSLLVGILLCGLPLLYLQPEISILSRVIGFFVISAPMLGLTILIPGAFGGGDIKLMAVSGIILGAQNIAVAMFIGILLGGGYAIYLLSTKKVEKNTHMSFGQYLCIGCYIAMLYGNELVTWYLGFF